MKLAIYEDDDYENPFGGGSVCYECPKCGSETSHERYGFGLGSEENAINRLKTKLSK